MARLAAADMAVRVGIDAEAIEGLRLAVDELCFHLLDDAAGDGVLTLRATGRQATGQLEVTAEVARSQPLPPLSEMADMLVRALTDDYHTVGDGSSVGFRVHLARKH